MKKPVALIILDGFGERKEAEANAIINAQTPNIDSYRSQYPFTTLGASGLDVGLPDGQMGNSEVGHMNIGAGRVVYQSYTKIDKAIADGDFYENDSLLSAFVRAKDKNTSVHLLGLLSDGGVHSHIRHFYALLKMAKDNGVNKVFIHAILDGRDVHPRSAEKYINDFENYAKNLGLGQIASVIGRYHAMDRDNRWDRIEKAYRAYVHGQGYGVDKAIDAVAKGYERNENDEFIEATVVQKNGKPIACIEDEDSVIFVNFRPDRARQITRALTDEDFNEFQRELFPKVYFVCMTQYNENYPLAVAFPPEELNNVLGQILEENGKMQLRIAETEKYAHVTFFFNGQNEKPFPHEDRKLVPSPQVPTYDLKPEMSAYEVENNLLARIKEDKYDVIILNLANPDMVGHTGVYKAAIQAVETVDTCLNPIVNEIKNRGGTVIITADHGNVEHMYDENKEPITSHTTNPVPFLLIGDDGIKLKGNGVLSDIAPTILDIMNIKQPEEMTGKSLIIHE